MTVPATERDFQQTVVETARALGYRVYHTFDSRRSEPGYPDLTLVRPGRPPVWLELKTEKGRLTDKQREWVELLLSAGCEVHVVRPDDFDQIVEVLL